MNTAVFASRLENVCALLEQIKAIDNPEIIKRAERLLTEENTSIENEIQTAKDELCTLEMQLGMLQYKIPKVVASCPSTENSTPPQPVTTVDNNDKLNCAARRPEAQNSRPQTSGRGKTAVKEVKSDASESIEVGRLDFRVGRIVEVSKHPDADSLYVEQVDLGEGSLRTVVSGLVKFVPIEAMHNLVSVFLCNLKPAKMRGVESQAMLMCASAPEAGAVEPLRIEGDAMRLGEAVVVPGYEGTPDQQLNPKKKIFETIKPFLRVDQSGLATYKGVPWTLRSAPKTVICAPTLRDVQIS